MNTKLCWADGLTAREIPGKGGAPAERLLVGYISTVDPDMDKDVVLPEGMDDTTYFQSTRSVNLDHVPTAVCGTNRHLKRVPGKGVLATTYISRSKLGEDVWLMVSEGIIRGFSIEWDPRTLDAGPPTAAEKSLWPGCKNVFRRWVLLAYALTARPCNPYATIQSIKSRTDAPSTEQVDIWNRLDRLVGAGVIAHSSAVAAGMPRMGY